NREWEEFTSFIDALTVPFFYVPGNHDYINEVMAQAWKKRFGKDYYHFLYKDVLFLCLNSEERMRGSGRGYIDTPQLKYVKETLAQHRDVKWTLVFLHQPLWDQADPGEWPEVEKALADRPHTVFAGHRHRYVKYERNQSKYFILATTGGGSSLRGPSFGEFDHVVWVTMTQDGPIIANLLLDGIWDESVHTEDMMAYSQPLLERAAVKAVPMFMDRGSSPQSLELRLHNRSDVPMVYDLQFRSTAKLWVASPGLSNTLAPNSSLVQEIPLQAAEDLWERPITPIRLEGSVTYLDADRPLLTIPVDQRLRPNELLPLRQESVEVDGKLDDWPTLRFDSRQATIEADPFSHQGPQDASYQWDVVYDEEFLYLAGKFTDDDLEIREGSSAWTQDGAIFYVDARPTQQSAYNNGRSYGSFLSIMANPSQENAEGGQISYADRLPKGSMVVCLRTKTGFVIEAKVPISYLETAQGKDWKFLRLNVVQRDFDHEGRHESGIFWLPDWPSEERLVGEGTFQR
ncbi:MAG: sugar-binding protein, partial [Bacteroidota bacterium]